MKISIEYRAPDAEGKRALRLTYYAGSYLDPATGIRKPTKNTSRWLFDHTRNPHRASSSKSDFWVGCQWKHDSLWQVAAELHVIACINTFTLYSV